MKDDDCLGLWRECCSNGKFSMLKHHQRNKRKREAEADESFDCIDDFADPHHTPPPGKRQSMGRRSTNVPHPKKDLNTGEWVPRLPSESLWQDLYCGELPPPDDYPAFYERFAEQFLLTVDMWKHLVSEARRTASFPKRDVMSYGHGGYLCRSPLDIMVLGALRVLAKGWGFAEVQECTFISAEVHRVFFREFTAYCSRVLFPMHVYHPKNTGGFRDKSHEFGMAGFPNCVHDSDGCVFNWPGCPAGDKNQAKSFKSNAPSVNCLLTWDHRHLVLSYTLGMGTMTDENLQPLDPFLVGICEGTIGGGEPFFLASCDKDGEITKQEYHGVYGMHDNGFLKWATAGLVPYKWTTSMAQVRFSEMCESMRKGSENGNADLKCRLKYFRTGFRQRNFEDVELTMRTGLALHNWRKRNDGFGVKWPTQKVKGVRKEPIEGFAARLDVQSTAVDDGTTEDPRKLFMDSVPSNGRPVKRVCEQDFEQFRHDLCQHWEVLWNRHLIFWPTSHGPQRLQGRGAATE